MERLKGANKNDMTVKYIIGHWTAGNYTPCAQDLGSYQLLINGEGEIHGGKPVGQTASTGGMNSITYNISCCGGLSRTPITKVQAEAFYKACAQKLIEFNLSVSDFYTHAEIGELCRSGDIVKLLPKNKWLNQNIGKVDLTVLPDIKGSPKQTGDFIRNKIKLYLQRL